MLKVEDVWKVAPGLPTPRREQRGGGEDAEGRGCSLCSCKGGVLFSKGGLFLKRGVVLKGGVAVSKRGVVVSKGGGEVRREVVLKGGLLLVVSNAL